MSEPSAAPPSSSPAVIHDLGYQRYIGTRRPQSTRWWVIVRNLLWMSWAGWWRLKVWVIGAFIATVAFGTVLYVSQNEIFQPLVGQAGQVTFADALVPFSYQGMFFPMIAFVVSLTVAASTVARDLSAGAFEFYFSRPVRPLDYVAGKLAGLFVIMWLCIGAGPLALSLFRFGLSVDGGPWLETLGGVGKIAVIGVVASLAFAAIPLGFSALTPSRGQTLAIWGGYYFILSSITTAVGQGTGLTWLGALDLKVAIANLSFGLFDIHFRQQQSPLGLWPSLAGLLGLSAAGLALAYWRVARAERQGLGGG